MPTYDYACSACGEVVEVVHGVHADGPTVCPVCGSGPIRKVFAAPTVVFKGSGWAKVDRRTKPKSASAKPADKDAAGDSKPASDSGSGGSGSADTAASTSKAEAGSSTPASPD